MMTDNAPQLRIEVTDGKQVQSVEDALGYLQDGLEVLGWRGQEGEAGWALVQLFGRVVELIFNRLNRVPYKHFLAFLNEATVNLLPPRPASTDLTFTPAKDGPPFIRVVAGTQVATIQTETQPEVVFETERDIVVSPTTLVRCIAFDPVKMSDRTAEATGQISATFAAFQGERERERILYLGDDVLFTFEDEASRRAAKITLNFTLTVPGDSQADGFWSLQWRYWDGTNWVDLEKAQGTITDHTNSFSQTGTIDLTNLPPLYKTEVGGVSGLWIACALTGGTARDHLPVMSSVQGSRDIDIASSETVGIDAAFSALQAGTAFVPLDPDGEFFPLGQRPGRLDTFYLMSDEAFTKEGATVTLTIDLEGIPGEVSRDELADSELPNLKLEWQYHSIVGWKTLGTSTWVGVRTATCLNFVDNTNAFTKSGVFTVSFDISQQDENDDCPLFAKTAVNDQEGYWIRVRLVQGGYTKPGVAKPPPSETPDEPWEWQEPVTYTPLIKRIQVSYENYTSEILERGLSRCYSIVDGRGRDHMAGALIAFTPFSASEEGPALYLGFSQAFPVGEWMQLLLDVDEGKKTSGTVPTIFWDYWDGSQWQGLRISDGSEGFSKWGFLGFFAPEVHQSSVEFGYNAHWARARPHLAPRANAGGDWTVNATGVETTVVLDGSLSKAFDKQKSISRYIWRLVSSNPPTAEAGEDQTVATPGTEATVTLAASGSLAAPERPIVRYTWRLVKSEQTGKGDSANTAMPFLKVIRTNTVPASNGMTIREEVLGSSDGKSNQVFTLSQPPVTPNAHIVVREPDRPPQEELSQLQKELGQADPLAQALLAAPEGGSSKAVWVRWHQVLDFYGSGPASRHFTLDPITGKVRFGDGKRGKIPPVGRDNVKVVLYRTHNSATGNVASGSVSVLRNPSGDLANIKQVTNPQDAAGGSDAESVEEVARRGPKTLKHRQRAVTGEDFIGLALEASGEVAQARCLPTRDPLGLAQPGWVTVIIMPKTTAAKPMPGPALLRRVKAYVEDHALANLKKAKQIHIKGPEYIEATVLAKVVACEPEKADQVELDILKRLEMFLHSLQGGPEGEGWELGRAVYLSEIYTEIEAVSGVDHVAAVQLVGSLQQHRLRMLREDQGYRTLPFHVSVGSQVSTFDERVKLLLGEPLYQRVDAQEGVLVHLKRLHVYGFKVDDKVAIVQADNTLVKDDLTIASISDASVTFSHGFVPPSAWPSRDALMSADGRLRLPLVAGGILQDQAGKVAGVKVEGFNPGDKISIVAGTLRHPNLEFVPVEKVEPWEDRIFVPEGHLVYSGSHDIQMVLE